MGQRRSVVRGRVFADRETSRRGPRPWPALIPAARRPLPHLVHPKRRARLGHDRPLPAVADLEEPARRGEAAALAPAPSAAPPASAERPSTRPHDADAMWSRRFRSSCRRRAGSCECPTRAPRSPHPPAPPTAAAAMLGAWSSVSLVTRGVADTARSRAFYEALGWSGESPDGDVVFFQTGGMILALWGRDKLAEDSVVADSGGWGGVTLAQLRRVTRGGRCHPGPRRGGGWHRGARRRAHLLGRVLGDLH